MSDESPKVVGLDGKPVTTVGNTDPIVVELLETMLEAARKGTYKACAIVLVDEDHGVVTAYHTRDHYDPIKGMSWVEFRINQGLADQ